MYTVYFELDKSTIPDSSLIQLVQITSKYTIEKVLIEGHCDSIGSKEYNYNLSKRRAHEVKKLLTTNGVNENQIQTCIGYGKDKPITSNINEELRAFNRRVLVHFFTKELPIEMNTKKTTMALAQFKAGKTIVLDNLFFYGGQHIIKPESSSTLETLCQIMNKNATLKIEIQGHVCCTNEELDGFDIDTKTNNLSVNRAKAIYNYLIKECGINASRLSYRGFGGSKKLMLDESLEEFRQKNRRVEISVISE